MPQEELKDGVGACPRLQMTPSPVDVRHDWVEISDRIQCVLMVGVLCSTPTILTARDMAGYSVTDHVMDQGRAPSHHGHELWSFAQVARSAYALSGGASMQG